MPNIHNAHPTKNITQNCNIFFISEDTYQLVDELCVEPCETETLYPSLGVNPRFFNGTWNYKKYSKVSRQYACVTSIWHYLPLMFAIQDNKNCFVQKKLYLSSVSVFIYLPVPLSRVTPFLLATEIVLTQLWLTIV